VIACECSASPMIRQNLPGVKTNLERPPNGKAASSRSWLIQGWLWLAFLIDYIACWHCHIISMLLKKDKITISSKGIADQRMFLSKFTVCHIPRGMRWKPHVPFKSSLKVCNIFTKYHHSALHFCQVTICH
jgi:hypothetical protein